MDNRGGRNKKIHIRAFKGEVGDEKVWHQIRGTHYYKIGQDLPIEFCRICGFGVTAKMPDVEQLEVEQGMFTICPRHLANDKFNRKGDQPQKVMDKYFEDLELLNDPKRSTVT